MAMRPQTAKSRPLKPKTSRTGTVCSSESDYNPILIKARYRSKLEETVAKQLEAEGIKFSYEQMKIPYTVPERQAKYITDFVVGDPERPMIIEAKGRFAHHNSSDARERQKFILLKQQYPDLDIRFVFQSRNTKIYPGSKTTVSQWADTHGFPWADKGKIPDEWLKELKKQV
jgi:hypothetical protein